MSRNFGAYARSILILIGLLLASFSLIGCIQPGPEPTPTPTKTPVGDQAGVAPDNEPQSVAAIATMQPPTPELGTAVPSTPIPPTPLPPTPVPQPQKPLNVAPYTGIVSDNPAMLSRRPLLICIGNDAGGRSAHAGLDQADLIYEYIMDNFSTTRMTALYHSQDAERIGSVRSARMPNIWMTHMYDGVLACSGASDGMRYLLNNEVAFPYLDADLDDPGNNRYFFSIGTDWRTRMQVSTDGVRRWMSENNIPDVWTRPGFQFDSQPPPNPEQSGAVIDIPYPGGNSVQWQYDAASGKYLRFQAGQAHMDQASGQQVSVENVIVIFATHTLTDMIEDSLGSKGVDIQLYGFGDFRIFRDGQAYAGTWRANQEQPPRWLGPGEVIVPLKPGQSWIQVVRDTDTIQYR